MFLPTTPPGARSGLCSGSSCCEVRQCVWDQNTDKTRTRSTVCQASWGRKPKAFAVTVAKNELSHPRERKKEVFSLACLQYSVSALSPTSWFRGSWGSQLIRPLSVPLSSRSERQDSPNTTKNPQTLMCFGVTKEKLVLHTERIIKYNTSASVCGSQAALWHTRRPFKGGQLVCVTASLSHKQPIRKRRSLTSAFTPPTFSFWRKTDRHTLSYSVFFVCWRKKVHIQKCHTQSALSLNSHRLL